MKWRNFPFAVLMVTLIGCSKAPSSSTVTESPQYKVLSVEDGKLSVALKNGGGKPIEVEVISGDSDYLKQGDVVEGKLSFIGSDKQQLSTIWRKDEVTDTIISDNGKQLHTQLLTNGKKAFRAVGDVIESFSLYNESGELVQSNGFRGGLTVLNFIFTRCGMPTMCPAATKRMKELQERAKEDGITNLTLYSISIDPEYDTPGVLKEYAKRKGIQTDNFHFLTGPSSMVDNIKKHHGIFIKDEKSPVMKHTMMTVLIDSIGKVAYQVPGSNWSVDDYLEQIKKLSTK